MVWQKPPSTCCSVPQFGLVLQHATTKKSVRGNTARNKH